MKRGRTSDEDQDDVQEEIDTGDQFDGRVLRKRRKMLDFYATVNLRNGYTI